MPRRRGGPSGPGKAWGSDLGESLGVAGKEPGWGCVAERKKSWGRGEVWQGRGRVWAGHTLMAGGGMRWGVGNGWEDGGGSRAVGKGGFCPGRWEGAWPERVELWGGGVAGPEAGTESKLGGVA